MPQIVTCPDCGRKLKVPDDLIGKKVKCPGCGQKFVGATDAPPEEEADEATAPRSAAVTSRADSAGRPRRRTEELDEDEDRPKSRRRDGEQEEDEDYPVRRRGGDGGSLQPTKGEVRTGWERVRFGINLVIIALWIAVGGAVTMVLGYLILALFGAASLGSMLNGGLSTRGPINQQQANQMAGQAAGTMTAVLVGGCLMMAILVLLALAYVACRLTGLGFCMGIASTKKTQTLKVLAIAVFSMACASVVLPMFQYGVAALSARMGEAGGCVVLMSEGLMGLLALAEFVCFMLFLRGVASVMRQQDLAQNIIYNMIAALVYGVNLVIVPFVLGLVMGAFLVSSVAASNPHNASAAAGNVAGTGVAMMVGGLVCFGVELLVGLGLFIWYMVLLYRVRSAVDGWLDRN